MALGNYDSWKCDADAAFKHEDASPPCNDNDVLRLKTPRYMLHVFYDRWLRLTTARLQVMTVPREGWKQLDEQVVAGDEPALAVATMRENRRRARGLFT